MPDPFKHVQPGDPLPLSQITWNAMIDAGRAFRRSELGKRKVTPEIFRQSGIIRMKNESGRALTRGSVLGLDRPLFLPSDSQSAFMREVTFRGTIPTTAHRAKFAVCLDPMDVGRIGRAFVDGVCQVPVDIRSRHHTCADVQSGDTTKLVSMDNGGSAQILWTETEDTGPQWAIVRIGTGCRVCCTSSSSSSSSSSHECPTHECESGCGIQPAACDMVVIVTGLNSADFACAQLNGTFHCIHVAGCTWFAAFGENPSFIDTTCTLSFDGANWTVEVVSVLGKHATFTGPGFDCQSAAIFNVTGTNCDVFVGAQAHVQPT